VPPDAAARVVERLAKRGYNATPEAVTLIATAADPAAALDRAVDAAPDATRLDVTDLPDDISPSQSGGSPGETEGSTSPGASVTDAAPGKEQSATRTAADQPPAQRPDGGADTRPRTRSGAEPEVRTATGAVAGAPAEVTVSGDITGRSTGTGEYADFVAVFRDRLERLSQLLRSRVTPRPASAVQSQSGGTETAAIGLVSDIRSTRNGHMLVELEDTTGTVACLVNADREVSERVDDLMLDEAIAVEGRLADDGGLVFADTLHQPDVPQTHSPTTADRPVSAALVSDLHVGSEEFCADAWDRFADWLHTAEAERIEHLLIAGDMVEGVGVYPDQDEELAITDVEAQYDRFLDRLAAVPDRISVVMIPGNHDAVRLAEPQPGFDPDLRDRLTATGARVVGNPSTVTVAGVSILCYHGMSLDEVIAEIPAADYDAPAEAMTHLLRKRHLAPQYGGRVQLAPEERDYLVIDEVPDVFHAGHIHKLGATSYHGVRVVNSGCWQEQTAFQRSVNIDPDPANAVIVDLDTLDVTIRSFGGTG
jgi:DNA polymerase II small subunit